jgi:hypothetical protein
VSENLPRLYRILGLEFLPEFGAARTGEKGYLTLPNWYGCQMFFDKDYPREVWQTVYSSNDQWEHMCNAPVFGITRQQGTLCGLITQGDYNTQEILRQCQSRGMKKITAILVGWGQDGHDGKCPTYPVP